MNIGFEAKRFFTNLTGLGNYSRFLLDALSQHYPENNYYLYTPNGSPNRDTNQILSRNNIKTVTPGSSYKIFKAKSLWRTWGISQHPTLSDLNIFHGLSHELPVGLPGHLKKVVTVHDLIFLRYPEFYNQIDIWIYKSKLTYACRNADKVIAISKQTAADLIQFLEVDPAKIEVVYQGCNINFKRRLAPEEVEAVKAKHHLPQDYILSVGTIEKRKNIILLVRALAQIPKESRVPLIIIGQHTSYFKFVVEEAERLGVARDIRFMNNIPFLDFPAIYQGAKVFIYPSLFEGFGIPLIEAIESGIPVITSNGSCFAEAAGPASIYIDPTNPTELKEAIVRVLSDEGLRAKMVKDSADYIRQFTADKVADRLINVYNSL